jgi:hypothetical protein
MGEAFQAAFAQAKGDDAKATEIFFSGVAAQGQGMPATK